MSKNKINEYILNHISDEDSVLKELNRETNLKVLMPRMLSGHLQGKLLEMLSKMIKPKYILEIGTYTGYSAICLAKGLQKNGMLHTIEINDELQSLIIKYLKKAGVNESVKLHIGNAIDIIKTLDYSFDLVFIDGDKRQYIEYYNAIFEKLNKGAYIIVDNVLWGNKIIEKPQNNDLYTKGIIDFNNYVYKDTRVSKIILPIRDGIMLLQKL